MRAWWRVAAGAAILLVALASCGGDDDTDEGTLRDLVEASTSGELADCILAGFEDEGVTDLEDFGALSSAERRDLTQRATLGCSQVMPVDDFADSLDDEAFDLTDPAVREDLIEGMTKRGVTTQAQARCVLDLALEQHLSGRDLFDADVMVPLYEACR